MQNAQFTSQVAQAVNQAIIDAIDNCVVFDWLPDFGYYLDDAKRRHSMWA